MDEKPFYGEKDCVRTGNDIFIAGKVVVLRPEILPEEHRGTGQLLFCTGGAGSGPDAADSYVRAVSLTDGECVRTKRSEILGLLRPELIPDRARLQLSQIRPLDSEIPSEPEFFGYCFLPDGRYAAGVPLSDELDTGSYIDVQRDYQHRLMICDSDDNCVFEMIDGKLIFPTKQMLLDHADEQQEQGIGGIDQSL